MNMRVEGNRILMVYALRCKHLYVERKRAPRWSTSLDRSSASALSSALPTVRVSHINNHYTTDKSNKHNRYRFVNCFTNPDEIIIIETSVTAD